MPANKLFRLPAIPPLPPGEGRGVRAKATIILRRTLYGALLGLAALMLWDAARLDLHGPAPSWLLLDRHERFLADIPAEGEEFGYWDVGELPPRVVAATLALEDRDFERHPGINPLAMARAVAQNVSSGRRISGASTIAMQVARLLHPAPRTYWNKLVESWRALVITARFGRQEVLAAYLRLIPYGNRMHGIAYVSRRALDKPVEDLSWAEIAYLSAIPQSPTLMNPLRESGRLRAIARGERLLDRLRESGVIPLGEYEIARAQIRAIRLPPVQVRPAVSLHAVFKLRSVLAGLHPAGREPHRVVTSIDLDTQRLAADTAFAAVQEWRARGAGNAAVIVVDRTSNEVLAWVGSTGYFDHDEAGAVDYAQAPRSPGSTLKPFIYALAYERGIINPATILDDLPAVREGIVNADHAYLGPMLPRQALANSRNVPAIQLLDRLGLEEGYAFLRDLGLHDEAQPAQHFGLGLAVGAMPVTLEHLVQAYSALAGEGRWRQLRWIPGAPAAEREVLSSATARLITLQLSDASARLPTFARMGSTEYSYPVALKTGTSQGARDAWTVAWSKRFLIGVWLGHPDGRPMHELTGASSAAEIARRILDALHGEDRNGSADLAFAPPEGYRPVALCALTGRRATAACDPVFVEWFAPGSEPQETDNAFVRLAVDVRNGGLAHAQTPARFVEHRTFVKLSPRYADWAAQAGIARMPDTLGPGATGEGAAPRASGPLEMEPGSSARIRIASPSEGLRLLRDPTIPSSLNTIALRAEVSPAIPQVLWIVDGRPFQLAQYPYSVRWPLALGEHTIQARAPFGKDATPPVHIRVE